MYLQGLFLLEQAKNCENVRDLPIQIYMSFTSGIPSLDVIHVLKYTLPQKRSDCRFNFMVVLDFFFYILAHQSRGKSTNIIQNVNTTEKKIKKLSSQELSQKTIGFLKQGFGLESTTAIVAVILRFWPHFSTIAASTT